MAFWVTIKQIKKKKTCLLNFMLFYQNNRNIFKESYGKSQSLKYSLVYCDDEFSNLKRKLYFIKPLIKKEIF